MGLIDLQEQEARTYEVVRQLFANLYQDNAIDVAVLVRTEEGSTFISNLPPGIAHEVAAEIIEESQQ